MSDFTDVTVEIAFTSSYSTPSTARVWTDVTDYAELEDGIEIGRGRSDERSQADASTLSLTLDNRDGRFTPDLASSPYYPNVKIGRPIRVTATPPGGSPSVRFLGYIDEWPVQWPDGTDAASVTTITAVSRMGRMAQSAELRSIAEETVLALGPVAYYPFGDPEGSTTAADTSGNRRNLTLIGTGTAPTFGSAIGVGTDGLTAVRFPGGGKKLAWSGVDPLAVSEFTVFGFYNTSASISDFYVITVGHGVAGSDLTTGAAIDISGGSILAIAKWPTPLGAEFDFISEAGSHADGTTRFVALAVTMPAGAVAGSMSLYDESGLLDTAALTPSTTALVESVDWVRFGDGNGAGTLSHGGVVDRVLTADEIAAIAEAGLTAGEGETPGARIERLAALAGIPGAEVVADTGVTSALALQHTEDTGALSLMQDVAVTEGGVVFDGRDGTLVFHDRARRYLSASEFTLDAAAQEVESDLAPLYDDFGMLNDVEATGGEDGTVVSRTVDQESIDEFGTYRDSRPLLTTSAIEVQATADWLVSRFSQPRVRIPSISVDVLNSGVALAASVLAADLDTRFTVTGLPSQAPATTLELLIEGYRESMSAAGHTITFNVSDASVYDVLILDDPDRGCLDSGHVLAY